MKIVDRRSRGQNASQLAKKSRRSLVALALLALPACATVPSLATPVDTLPSDELGFQGVTVTQTKQGLRVSGIVRRTAATSGAVWGHLHIAALRPQGAPVTVDTRWSGNLSGRAYRTATFSALIPDLAPEEVRSIVVTHRTGPDGPR